jgi:3-methyladenine DNA glycosylase AlkD
MALELREHVGRVGNPSPRERSYWDSAKYAGEGHERGSGVSAGGMAVERRKDVGRVGNPSPDTGRGPGRVANPPQNAREADDLGQRLAALVQARQPDQAYTLLASTLAERTPFRLLDRIGRVVGAGPLPEVNALLERIAAEGLMGGWVVIGSALGQQLDRDLEGAFLRCRASIVVADVWYGADILGERVPGPALVRGFEAALPLLAPWRADENRWVRRAVGVATHFWAKRSRGAPELSPRAEALLAFLEPMFEEWEMDAVKGVGWGLKTLGRHYPDRVTDWLVEQVAGRNRRHRALMLRKAMTYLPEEHRARIAGSEGDRVPLE